MKQIILDTNFLLIPANFHIDIFSEIDRICHFKHELYILDKTIQELNEIIKSQKGRDKAAAKLALLLLKKKNVHEISTNENLSVDDLTLKTANKQEFMVATLDKELRKKLRDKCIPLIVMRKGKYLILEGYK